MRELVIGIITLTVLTGVTMAIYSLFGHVGLLVVAGLVVIMFFAYLLGALILGMGDYYP